MNDKIVAVTYNDCLLMVNFSQYVSVEYLQFPG